MTTHTTQTTDTSKLNIEIPEYFNPLESDLIDDDVKTLFKGKSYMAESMVQMQLIKTMKDLIEAIYDMPDFQFDENGRLITTVRNY